MLASEKRFAACTLIYRWPLSSGHFTACNCDHVIQDAKKLKDAVSALCARHGGGAGGEDEQQEVDTEKSEVP